MPRKLKIPDLWIKMYQTDDDGNWNIKPTCTCFLGQCFPDADDDEYAFALDALLAHGSYVTGGGAAPLVMLKKIDSSPPLPAPKLPSLPFAEGDVCACGNDANDSGFDTVDSTYTRYQSPDLGSTWNGTYLCVQCGQAYHTKT